MSLFKNCKIGLALKNIVLSFIVSLSSLPIFIFSSFEPLCTNEFIANQITETNKDSKKNLDFQLVEKYYKGFFFDQAFYLGKSSDYLNNNSTFFTYAEVENVIINNTTYELSILPVGITEFNVSYIPLQMKEIYDNFYYSYVDRLNSLETPYCIVSESLATKLNVRNESEIDLNNVKFNVAAIVSNENFFMEHLSSPNENFIICNYKHLSNDFNNEIYHWITSDNYYFNIGMLKLIIPLCFNESNIQINIEHCSQITNLVQDILFGEFTNYSSLSLIFILISIFIILTFIILFSWKDYNKKEMFLSLFSFLTSLYFFCYFLSYLFNGVYVFGYFSNTRSSLSFILFAFSSIVYSLILLLNNFILKIKRYYISRGRIEI